MGLNSGHNIKVGTSRYIPFGDVFSFLSGSAAAGPEAGDALGELTIIFFRPLAADEATSIRDQHPTAMYHSLTMLTQIEAKRGRPWLLLFFYRHVKSLCH